MTEDKTDELPLPEADLEADHEWCGQNVKSDVYFVRTIARFARDYHADQMRKLREAQGLSDERIDALLEKYRQGKHVHHFRAFAHAIADPLLARIAELEAEVEGYKSAGSALVGGLRDERDALRTQLAEAQRELTMLRNMVRSLTP